MSNLILYLKQRHSCGHIIKTQITITEDHTFQFRLSQDIPLDMVAPASSVKDSPALVCIPLGKQLWMTLTGNIENTAIDLFRGTLCPQCGENVIKDTTVHPAKEIQLVWEDETDQSRHKPDVEPCFPGQEETQS